MKPVLLTDISAATRALLAAPASRRPALADWLLAEAEGAALHNAAFGEAHAEWGDGTLMGAALAHPVASEPRLDDPEHIECQIIMLRALYGHLQPLAQDTQRKAVGSSAKRLGSMSSPQSSQ